MHRTAQRPGRTRGVPTVTVGSSTGRYATDGGRRGAAARYLLDMAVQRPDSNHPGSYHSATLHPADGHLATNCQGVYLIRWQ